MSDKKREYEIDELLSGYLDGELSQRQHTEVQRLIEHDPDTRAKVDQLRKQKLLMLAMPVESAPDTLIDDIKIAMERKLILDESPTGTSESEGRRQLYFRRAMTAAVIFVLLGSLIAIVVNIIAPAPASNDNFATNTNTGIDSTVENTSPLPRPEIVRPKDEALFSANLALTTKESIAMSSFVWKAIFNNGLRDDTYPERLTSKTTYQITSDVDRVIALLNEIATAWDRCDTAALSAYSAGIDSDIVIENITAQQAVSVFTQDNTDKRLELAKVYATLNTSTGDDREQMLLAMKANDSKDVPPIPIKPEYTSGPKTPVAKPDHDAEKVTLIITITGI